MMNRRSRLWEPGPKTGRRGEASGVGMVGNDGTVCQAHTPTQNRVNGLARDPKSTAINVYAPSSFDQA